jgi:DNA uptake protein ComE-like DNA-binding protein
MDINQMTKQDFLKISGFTEERADAVMRFLQERGGKINSMEQLKGIPGFDNTVIDTLKKGGVTVGG